MAKIAVATGIILIALGVVGYVTTPTEIVDTVSGETVDEKKPSVTSLIPAFIGLPIFLCGLWGVSKPAYNKIAMHVAVVFALLGGIAASGRAVTSLVKWFRGDEFNARAFVYISLMAVVCLMFFIACIKSFMDARKARLAAAEK